MRESHASYGTHIMDTRALRVTCATRWVTGVRGVASKQLRNESHKYQTQSSQSDFPFASVNNSNRRTIAITIKDQTDTEHTYCSSPVPTYVASTTISFEPSLYTSTYTSEYKLCCASCTAIHCSVTLPDLPGLGREDVSIIDKHHQDSCGQHRNRITGSSYQRMPERLCRKFMTFNAYARDCATLTRHRISAQMMTKAAMESLAQI